ncbi:hypothetical protein JCM5350_001560 [Sporobolomyces pararoseus]
MSGIERPVDRLNVLLNKYKALSAKVNAETLRSGGKLLESTGRSIIAELDKITQMADAVLNQFCGGIRDEEALRNVAQRWCALAADPNGAEYLRCWHEYCSTDMDQFGVRIQLIEFCRSTGAHLLAAPESRAYLAEHDLLPKNNGISLFWLSLCQDYLSESWNHPYSNLWPWRHLLQAYSPLKPAPVPSEITKLKLSEIELWVLSLSTVGKGFIDTLDMFRSLTRDPDLSRHAQPTFRRDVRLLSTIRFPSKFQEKQTALRKIALNHGTLLGLELDNNTFIQRSIAHESSRRRQIYPDLGSTSSA